MIHVISIDDFICENCGSSGIVYPAGETTSWYGFKRHNFELEGCRGFIVEPPDPAPGLPWSWCLQWAEAFVPRTPALKLLERGFHHVHLDVFDTRLNPAGVKKLESFYGMLRKMGFHKKAALIGMSYGGLFSLRWAAEHPETVGVIYLDAPACDLAFAKDRARMKGNMEAYGVTTLKALHEHKLSPLNNILPIAKAKIPILAIRSGQDQSVIPGNNIDLFSRRFSKAGGEITIVRRDGYGHHPHGLDNPMPLVHFILQHYPEV